MDVRFDNRDLDRLEIDARYSAGFSDAIVKAFRKRLQMIRAAPNEMDFYQLRSLRFERLKGKRKHQYSMRLNDQWRLILEFEGQSQKKTVVIKGIEDYH